MNAPIALAVFELPDTERPGAVLSLAVCAFGQRVHVSNTTDEPVRILLCGREQLISPSPYRGECIVEGLLVYRPADDLDGFDFRAVCAAHLADASPFEIDGLCVELLAPCGVPSVH